MSVGLQSYLRPIPRLVPRLASKMDCWQNSDPCNCRTETFISKRLPVVPCHVALFTTWQFASSEPQKSIALASNFLMWGTFFKGFIWLGRAQGQAPLWLTQNQLIKELNWICKVPLPLPHKVTYSWEWLSHHIYKSTHTQGDGIIQDMYSRGGNLWSLLRTLPTTIF